jgi:hypothetical protein
MQQPLWAASITAKVHVKVDVSPPAIGDATELVKEDAKLPVKHVSANTLLLV